MPEIQVTCYGCNDQTTISAEQFNRYMEEFNYCDIESCETETCSECSAQCDKCLGVYCLMHYNGATRMCIECDPKEENN